MDKQATLVAAWFGASFTTLIFTLIMLIFINIPKTTQLTNQNFKLYAAIPPASGQTSDGITSQDARAKIVENFFTDYQSILAPYANHFIQAADKYQLDWRLLPAISMQESNGGKRLIRDSFNPFGYGIYGTKVIRFSSWDEGIETVAKSLREDYLDQGLNSPEEIMTKYTPPSLAKGGAWAKGVRSFMFELQ